MSTPVPPAPGRLIHHTVQPGESLESIAKKYYGRSGEWVRLFNANRQHAAGPGLLRPGATIVVPQ